MDGVFGSDTGAAVLVRPDGYAGLTSPISSAVGHLALLRVRQQLAPPEIPGDSAKVIEHDKLDPAWQKFRNEIAKLDAA